MNPHGIAGYAVFRSGRREGTPVLFETFAPAKKYAGLGMLIWPCDEKEWGKWKATAKDKQYEVANDQHNVS